MKSKTAIQLAFLIGLGAVTQVYLYGCIGISELVMFLVAPVILCKDLTKLKRDGFGIVLVMLLFVMFGCLLSSWLNKSPIVFVIKSFAQLYSTFAAIIIFHRLFRANPRSLGWFFLGSAISEIIAIFVFHPVDDVHTGITAPATIADITGGVLFWSAKVRNFAILPIILSYLRIPLMYSVVAPLGIATFAMFASASGRAIALTGMCASGIMAIGGKTRRRMAWIGRHLLLLMIGGVVIVAIFRMVYKYSASSGMLGEEAYNKYRQQSAMGESSLRILMSGRKEFFLSLPACIDHPILGLGPKCEDDGNYVYDFLSKYGTNDEFAYYVRTAYTQGYRGLPCHSHITSFWLWFGLPGLIYWLYIIYLIYYWFRRCTSAVPQWFGYFAFMIPKLFWDMFFTPYNSRIGWGVMIAALLMARLIANGKMSLPYDMIIEAQKHEN